MNAKNSVQNIMRIKYEWN